MSEIRDLLAGTARQIFTDHCTREVMAASERGEWPTALWGAVEASGLTQATAAGADADFRPDIGDVLALVRLAGEFAVPVPFAETLLATWIATACGLAPPPGPLTVAPVFWEDSLTLEKQGGAWRLSGAARGVPWGGRCEAIVALADHCGQPHAAVVAALDLKTEPVANLAGEPRANIAFDVVLSADSVAPCPADIDFEQLWTRGALYRAAAMAGTLDKILPLTIGYASERVQFGRPLAKFQAVQQQLSVLAGCAGAADVAIQAAAQATVDGDGHFATAVAKARIGEAATLGASIAHQVHGAMGFTREYELHLSTRRIWTWREEFGDESWWQGWLGHRVAEVGAEHLWAHLVDLPADARTISAEAGA